MCCFEPRGRHEATPVHHITWRCGDLLAAGDKRTATTDSTCCCAFGRCCSKFSRLRTRPRIGEAWVHRGNQHYLRYKRSRRRQYSPPSVSPRASSEETRGYCELHLNGGGGSSQCNT